MTATAAAATSWIRSTYELSAGSKSLLALRVRPTSAPESVRAPDGRHPPDDLAGTDNHVFTGEDEYVWNNGQGDYLLLFVKATNTTIDEASDDRTRPRGGAGRAADEFVAPVARPRTGRRHHGQA